MKKSPRRAMMAHATIVVVGEAAVMLRGPSGAGKSRLALALIAESQRRGLFSRLVGDDQVNLLAIHGGIVARPHPILAGLIEQRGAGLLRAPHEPAARVTHLIELTLDEPPRLPDGPGQTGILAVHLPCLSLPAGLGPDEGARRILSFLNFEMR